MPKISVIIPAFNKEKYLSACLNSVIHGYEKDIEIICINDHSTDQSLEVLKKFAKIDSRIKVIDMVNHSGVSWARNLGLQEAQGEYIAFVDADDIVSKNMYNDYYQYAKYYDASIVKGHFYRINESDYLEDYSFESSKTKPTSVDFFSYEYVFYEESPAIWNKIYSHELLKDTTFLEDHIYEDIAFTYPLLLKAPNILEIDEVDYYYRRTPKSILNNQELINPRLMDLVGVYKECLRLGKSYRLSPYQINLLKGRVKQEIIGHLWAIYQLAIYQPEEKPEEKAKLLADLLALFYQIDYKFLTTSTSYESLINDFSMGILMQYVDMEKMFMTEESLKKDTLERIKKINRTSKI